MKKVLTFHQPILYTIAILLLAMCVHCSKKEPVKENPLLGSWHFKRKNIYEILTFRANGSFAAQIRIEGRFSKIIEKKEAIEGTYVLAEKKLTMTPNGKLSSGEFKDGTLKVYEVTEVNKEKLSLTDDSGAVKKWDRVRGQQESKEVMSASTAVGLGPLVVNLKKHRSNEKNRYICLDLEFILGVKQLENQIISLHPRVREISIFYLSTLSYTDVNSLNKIAEIKAELRTLVKPYVKYEIKDITIKNVIVTASIKAVDEFLGTSVNYEESGSTGSQTPDEKGKKSPAPGTANPKTS